MNQVLSCRLSHLASLARGWAVKLYSVCVGVVLDLEVVSSRPTTRVLLALAHSASLCSAQAGFARCV